MNQLTNQSSQITNPEIVAPPENKVTYETVNGFVGRTLDDPTFTFKMPYRLYIPEEYDPNKSYPLVFALHGMGLRGDDNMKQIGNKAKWATSYTLPAVQKKDPCFVLAPQCPTTNGVTFSPMPLRNGFSIQSFDYDLLPQPEAYQMAMKILSDTLNEFNIDRSRIYLTGNSMGGFSTWYFAIFNPDLFAAAMPFAGGGDSSKTQRIAHMPIWNHHGDADNVVPVEFSRIMMDALAVAGGIDEHKYTEYPGGGHGVFSIAFSIDNNNDGIADVVEWMLKQRKK